MLNPLLLHTVIYIICFILVWMGAGLVVSTISKLAKSWKISPFIVSFFLLGSLTSLPEVTIGSLAVLGDDPTIFVGNLLGGVIIIFLAIIPLLGIVGNGVKMPRQISQPQMLLTLLVVVAPALLTADQIINQWEAVLLLLLYGTLFVFFAVKQSLFAKVQSTLTRHASRNIWLLLKVAIGVVLLVGASQQIINSTLFFAEAFTISPFFISLIVVSLGTNIPELSLIVRAVLSGKKDIALADYLGSATANTLLFAIFTLWHGKTIILPNHFLQRFAFLGTGLVLFFFFAKSKDTLSRKESLVLFSLYIGLVLFELFFLAAQV